MWRVQSEHDSERGHLKKGKRGEACAAAKRAKSKRMGIAKWFNYIETREWRKEA